MTSNLYIKSVMWVYLIIYISLLCFPAAPQIMKNKQLNTNFSPKESKQNKYIAIKAGLQRVLFSIYRMFQTRRYIFLLCFLIVIDFNWSHDPKALVELAINKLFSEK